MPDLTLAGRTALVTGAASGIGRATAERFAAAGAALLLVDLDEERLRVVEHAAERDGAACAVVAGDVGDEATAEGAVAACIDAHGRLDLLVNAAGIAFVGTVLETTLDDWDRVFRTNVRSIFLLSRAAIPHLRGGGAIVNVASEAGLVGFPSYAAYSASKAAVVNLTRSMALDHAADGIRVNCVCPGSIDTPLLRRFYDDQPDPGSARAQDEAEHPLGIGTPGDVAEGVLYLSGPRSAYVTGHALAIDGGYTCR